MNPEILGIRLTKQTHSLVSVNSDRNTGQGDSSVGRQPLGRLLTFGLLTFGLLTFGLLSFGLLTFGLLPLPSSFLLDPSRGLLSRGLLLPFSFGLLPPPSFLPDPVQHAVLTRKPFLLGLISSSPNLRGLGPRPHPERDIDKRKNPLEITHPIAPLSPRIEGIGQSHERSEVGCGCWRITAFSNPRQGIDNLFCELFCFLVPTLLPCFSENTRRVTHRAYSISIPAQGVSLWAKTKRDWLD
jgi:hypothetical protein